MTNTEIEKLFNDNCFDHDNYPHGHIIGMTKIKFIEVVSKIVGDKEECNFSVNEHAIVFNEREWSKIGDMSTNEKFYQEARIIRLRFTTEWIADVIFSKSGKQSNGHFVRCIAKL